MTWSYLSTAPGTSDRSWIRLRTGDNTSGDELLQDEEIDALLTQEGNKFMAGAMAAETIGAQFARRADKTIGRLRTAISQASLAHFRLAGRLRMEGGMRVSPVAGGISVSDKETVEQDTDRVVPSFSIGFTDYPSQSTS